MMVGHHAYAPICRLMQDHPGAEIIIGSCMSRNAVEDVLDDVERVAGRRPRFFDASSGFDGLEAVMKTLNALHELPPPCGSECTQDATGG
jgi:hypothetical protein